MRKLLFTAYCSLFFIASFVYAQAPNDECATATVISSIPFNTSQNTRLASVNLADPKFSCNDTDGLGKTVWFKYVATADSGLVFSTLGSTPGSDFDIMLGIFSGTCGSLKFEDCNDDAGGTRQSELYFRVKNGTTYYILVGEWANGGTSGGTPTGGDLVFKVSGGMPPELVKGPKLGTVATGAMVSISSFPNVFPKAEGGVDEALRVIENKEIEIKQHQGPLKVLPMVKRNGHQNAALAPEGSNYFEDRSASVAAIGRPVITKGHQGIPQTNSIPPDPIMAVGPNHIIVMVNTSFRIFDKNGTALKTVTAANFYNGIAPGTGPNDPQVLYDHYAKRFIMLWMTSPTTTDHRHLIAVSKDSNAMGDWYMWSTSAIAVGDSSTHGWGDYPALSYDQNAVYLTSNQFDLTANTFLYAKLRIFDKSKLVANTAGEISFQDFWDFKDPQTQATPGNIRPMNGYSNATKSFMMNVAGTSPANYMTVWSINNPASVNPSLSAKNIPVVQYSTAGNANQLGGGTPLIESGSSRIRANIIYRDSMLWAVHSVANGAGSAVRYVKINPYTETTLEDAAFGLTGYWHFYPAIMVDENQNVLLTYSRSGGNEFAGAFVSGRKKNDPPGISSAVAMREGLGNYVLTFGGTRNRWGDYSGVGLDPSDQSVMWAHTEFANNSNTWSTWVSKTKIGPLPGAYASLSRTSLNFGTKLVGQSSDTLEVTLTNDGLDSLIITSISNTGANYLVVGKPPTPAKLESQGIVSLKIAFKPSASGPLNDSIVITTNDSEKPVQAVKLSGNGFSITMAEQGTIYSVSNTSDGNKLYSVNSGNGITTPIGGIGISIAAMRVHPASKELIGYDNTSSSGGSFYRISSNASNIQNISTTTIPNLKGLAFENDSMVFMGTFAGGIYRVNYKSGQTTLIGSNAGLRVGGLALNPVNGTLWMSVRNTSGDLDAIYKINKTTGAATKVGNAGIGTPIFDILFDKNGKLYGLSGAVTTAADNKLIVIDTVNGSAVVKGALGKSGLLCIALNPDAVADIPGADQGKIPVHYSLQQNYPNPFNPMTTIKFTLPVAVKVTLRVYDAIGREVSTLADGIRTAGFHTEYFDASHLSSGVYYYKLTAGSFSDIKKMIVIK